MFDITGLDPYYCAPMFKPLSNKPLPKQGDPRKFAQQGIQIQGFVRLADLPRLAEAAQDMNAQVDVDLTFGVDEERHKIVTGTAQGELTLVCQRCLENLKVVVTSDVSLAIVWDEEHAEALPESLEPWITGEGLADFYAMIEDEMLLNLPVVVYHQELCIDQKLFESGKPAEVKKTQNPFQVLEQIKSTPK